MQRVIERILNLLAFLLTAERPVTADEIRHTVAGYDQPSDEAFRRTFERDKDLLRQLGIPLKLQHTDAWEVEQGYVVPAEEYALPDPGLTDEERAALGLAAQVVRLGGQAPGPSAVFKLGGSPAPAGSEPLAADLGEAEEDLAVLFAAVTERRVAGFDYRGTRRRVRPYGLVHRLGHWYLVALPEREHEIRTYRVDRLDGLRIGDRSDAYQIPAGFRAADALPEAPWEAGPDTLVVEVEFDASAAWWVRRQLTPSAEVDERSDGSLLARVPVANVDAFLGWIIGFEDQAAVLGPPEVRSAMIAHLEAG
jgi:proteasome accessory factor B